KESTLQFSTTYILQSQVTGSSHFIGPTLRYNQKIFKKNASIGLGNMYAFNKINQIRNHILSHQISFYYTPKFWDEKYGELSFALNTSLLQNFESSNKKISLQGIIFVDVRYKIKSK
ncbi:MAG: hypothetical protein KDC84_13050, partial [Crocinitomicaceae bacterium]|nr:hypothetical protein [Crocinitomicaceae bacterium]